MIGLDMDGAVAVVTLDNPATMNALSPASARTLNRVLAEAAGRARAILLTGAGRAFCTGADLSAGPEPHWIGADGRIDAGMSLDEIFSPLASTIRELAVPIVKARPAYVDRPAGLQVGPAAEVLFLSEKWSMF